MIVSFFKQLFNSCRRIFVSILKTFGFYDANALKVGQPKETSSNSSSSFITISSVSPKKKVKNAKEEKASSSNTNSAGRKYAESKLLEIEAYISKFKQRFSDVTPTTATTTAAGRGTVTEDVVASTAGQRRYSTPLNNTDVDQNLTSSTTATTTTAANVTSTVTVAATATSRVAAKAAATTTRISPKAALGVAVAAPRPPPKRSLCNLTDAELKGKR